MLYHGMHNARLNKTTKQKHTHKKGGGGGGGEFYIYIYSLFNVHISKTYRECNEHS